MSRRSESGLWSYLESLGVLERGTDEEIQAAKLAYRKQYYLHYKRSQRVRKPEFTVNFSSENGEFQRVAHEARRHQMSLSGFIHQAVLSYISQRFIVPNAHQVSALEQLLADCLNEVQKIVSSRGKFYWQTDQKLQAIENRIERLEAEIDRVLRNPPLDAYDHQIKIL